MFSLSCAWNSARHDNARDMIREIKDLGINRIELNFALTKDFVCDIISLREKNEVEVTSLHNFCPIPDGVPHTKPSPDYYSLASLDKEERELAINATKETILTARKLRALAVILHMGRINIKDRTRDLANSMDNHSQYNKIKSEMISDRERYAKAYFYQSTGSLKELSNFARDCGVKLGIENRYYYNEIPSKDEIGMMLDPFKNEIVGYWHDVGHAQIFENIGLCKHIDYLEPNKDKIIGIHLHDVIGIDDHLAPLQGKFDFSTLKPYITKNTILVLEPHYPATANDIKKGIAHLENIFKDVVS